MGLAFLKYDYDVYHVIDCHNITAKELPMFSWNFP